MIKDVEHFFICVLAIWTFIENCVLISLAYSWIVLFIGLCLDDFSFSLNTLDINLILQAISKSFNFRTF